MSSFKFIDLFAGIGGLRIPFDEIGGECVFTSEIDKHARQTYSLNFGVHEEEIAGDIRNVPTKLVPEHDILLAGFPCQPFSNAGHRLGFEDTRGTLFFEIQRIAHLRKPRVILLENVRGLVSHDSGNTLKRIIEILSRNYIVHYKLLNARDFGLPQNRIRIFIVCIRKDLDQANGWEFPQPTHDRNALKLSTILDKRVPDSFTISDKLWASHQKRKLNHIANGNGFGYRLFERKAPYVSTLSARYYKDGSEVLISQGTKNPRMLTPLEAKRLQGFPDWFSPSESKTQAYKQFGNAVPVSVVRAIAQSLEATLKA